MFDFFQKFDKKISKKLSILEMKFSNKFCQIFEKNENLFPEFGQKTCIHEWISKKMTLKKILEVIFCENFVF